MKRETVSILFGSEPNFDEYALKYFLSSINKIQNQYEFIFPDFKKPDPRFFYNKKYYKPNELYKIFNKLQKKIDVQKPSDYKIIIITSQMGQNYFTYSNHEKKVSFVSTHEWEKYYSPPSLFEYIVTSIVHCLLFMNEVYIGTANIFSNNRHGKRRQNSNVWKKKKCLGQKRHN